jgi:hypothetical protein
VEHCKKAGRSSAGGQVLRWRGGKGCGPGRTLILNKFKDFSAAKGEDETPI